MSRTTETLIDILLTNQEGMFVDSGVHCRKKGLLIVILRSLIGDLQSGSVDI